MEYLRFPHFHTTTLNLIFMCIYLAGNVSGEDKKEKNRKLKENVDLTENIYLFPFILAKKNNLFDFLG